MTLLDEYNAQQPAIELLLSLLKDIIDSAATQVCQEHYTTRPHESIMTGRLIQQIENDVRQAQLEVKGLAVEVLASDFSQKLEKSVGADLYVSVARLDTDDQTTKGILAQVKWDRALPDSEEWRRLRNQSQRMLRRSKIASETWVLTEAGVLVVDAWKTANPHRPNNLLDGAKTPGQHITQGLRCNYGDKLIGRDRLGTPRQGIDRMKKKLRVPRMLGFDVKGAGW